jgi:hypothetical protein
MGGASSGAYKNSLAGVGVPPAELFAREAIQNSVDAAQEGADHVRVQFREVTLSAKELVTLNESLRLVDGAGPSARKGLLPDEDGDIRLQLRAPFKVLFVEDFNTKGLGGTTEPVDPSEEDNYVRLVLTLGDTREAQGGGGTFGFGKSVYWAMSSVWTVVMYSRFTPTDRTDRHSARLISVSWFNPHTHASAGGLPQRFTGRAWFGAAESTRCPPLVDADAHELAGRLGFASRSADERGTSILILGSQLDMDGLQGGVERHWWPRLLQGRLQVATIVDGNELPGAHPRSNPDLRRFVRAWDLARGSIEPGDRDQVKQLTYKAASLGKFAITTGSEEEEEELGSERVSRQVDVALMREPGMVVDYLEGPVLSATQPSCGAVFVADADMNSTYAKSEPPSHNKWDFRTFRRDRALTEDERRKIEMSIDKIKSAARQFVRSKQAPPATPPPRCRELEKLLGKWIGVSPDTPPPPPPGKDPFVIRFVEDAQRVHADAGVVLDAKLDVGLRDDDELEAENLIRVRAWVDTIVDDGAAAPRQERLRMAYMVARDEDGTETPGEQDAQGSYVDLVLRPGGPASSIDVRSERLPHAEYRASFSMSTEVLE